MPLDKPLCFALIISLIFHTVIFLPLANFHDFPIRKSTSALKISYVVPKMIPAVQKKKPEVQKKAMTIGHKADYAPQLKEQLEKEKAINKSLAKNEKIEIPPELPKEKEPLYISYYQSIREKIRRYVVKNYPRFIACGEVCLFFVLSADGKLKEIKVVEERSSPNDILKEIAKKSVRQAEPFETFPKNMDQMRLSFNVIISFELEE